MAAPPSDKIPAKLADSESIGKACAELEVDLAGLRNKYEQYFLGIERHAPTAEHDAFKRRLSRVTGAFTRSTAVRFRVNTLQAKTVTYERLWARTVQEIENGTYRRDVYKARLHSKDREPPKAEAKAARDAPPTPAPRAPAVAPAGPPAVPLSDAKVRAIYDAYVLAKRTCNEDVSKLSMEGLASTLRKQVPELLKKHNAKDVDFKVVIKDGKASLRAFPK